MILREHANDQGCKLYDEEYKNAMVKREEVITGWRETNPDSILADGLLPIYRTWPANLMGELDEIDREAIRNARRKYLTLLLETEKEMQTLVAFWTDCGLVTGQRTPPSSWWQDPKAKAERLPKPQYLKERLDAINTEFGYLRDKAEKLRMIEMSCWIESIINGDYEPAASDTLPQSLLDELDIVWQGQTIWQDRLRPRRGAISAALERPYPVQRSTRKPKGIVKEYRRKAPEQKRQTTSKDQATTSITQKAGTSHLSGTNSYFNEASLQSRPASVLRARRTKNARRQPPHQASTVQPQGVQKTRNSKGRQTRLR